MSYTQEIVQMGHIKPFWDDDYKRLDYRKEIFNDESFLKSEKKGYTI